MSNAWPTPPQPPGMTVRPAPPSSQPFDSRRGAIDRLQALQARVHRIIGFVSTTGTGTVTVDVNFPVWFVELPAISHGWSLEDGQQLEKDNFPTVDVGAARWLYRTTGPVRYWIGATLALTVCKGRLDQRIIVHWQAEGMCLRSPGANPGGT